MTEISPRGAGASSGRFLGHTLPSGARIGNFEITGLIGEGGFGIVYLAYDAALQRQVALKEYMPSSLASRATESHDISVKSDRHAETFNAGLKSFVNEARLLARFDHPSLVKVYQFFEANHTAYMAMPYYEGPTLKRALAELGHAPDEALLREWLRPLLNALAVMHKEHCYHRDIAPDNILLTPAGPLLLDFGAARRVIGDMTHALTVVLKPGYAPIEQYGEAASMAQGPWTDLYALASVVYYAITGHAPTTSVERVMGDELASLASLASSRYSAAFLTAIDTTLAVRPKDRPQDVAAFCELLNRGLPPDSPIGFRLSGFQSSGFDPLGGPFSRFEPALTDAATLLLSPVETVQPIPPPAGSTMPRTAVPAAIGPTDAAEAPAEQAVQPRSQAVARPSLGPRMTRTLALAGAAALAAAALAFYFGTRSGSVPPAPTSAREPGPDATPASTRPATQSSEPIPAATATPAFAPAPTPPAARPTSTTAPPAPPGAVSVPVETVAAPAAQRSKADASLPLRPETKSKPAAAAAAPRSEAPPRNAGVNAAKCSDILQRASLEPITEEEAAYLRKECR